MLKGVPFVFLISCHSLCTLIAFLTWAVVLSLGQSSDIITYRLRFSCLAHATPQSGTVIFHSVLRVPLSYSNFSLVMCSPSLPAHSVLAVCMAVPGAQAEAPSCHMGLLLHFSWLEELSFLKCRDDYGYSSMSSYLAVDSGLNVLH